MAFKYSTWVNVLSYFPPLATYEASTLVLWISLAVSFCLINSNGFDLLWFIYNFPQAFDIQSADIKNSGLTCLGACVPLRKERSLNTGVWIWCDMQTEVRETFVEHFLSVLL